MQIGHARPLMRTVHDRPPSLQSAGWLVSEQSRDDLAKLLGTDQTNVRLLFYSPLPFAGAEAPRARASAAVSAEQTRPAAPAGRVAMASMAPVQSLSFLLAQRGPSGGFPGGGFPGGGFPGGGFPGGGFPGGGFPGGGMPGGGFPGPSPSSRPSSPPPSQPTTRQTTPPPATAPSPSTSQAPSPQGAAAPAPTSAPQAAPPPAPSGAGGPRADVPRSEIPAPNGARSIPLPSPARGGHDGGALPQTSTREPTQPHIAAAETAVAGGVQAAAPDTPDPAAQRANTPASRTDWVLPQAPPRGLFGLAPAPFVQGDFVAAQRIAPDRWVTVQPVPEPFPNSWQRRVLLWFAISFSVVAPIGYLFARRLVAPLTAFAGAAERLGRDPSGPIMALNGPAEIGRATTAFTGMQQRLKRYIDNRNAMMGAISHDLRTPLARMRFRLERAPADLKPGMLGDVAQMDDMISSVLVFMRDGSEPSVRERLDLRSLLECVVDDAAMVGGDAVLDPGAAASVEVDSLGVRRVVTNLVENALKYGRKAHVRLFIDAGDAVTEIADAGPGLPDEELERVFAPFYRAANTRAHKPGIGLGLAVSRSIARAHGGDVRLIKGDQGLVAQLRLPLAQAA